MKTQFSMQKAKAFATQLLWEFIGSVFIAAGIYNFAVQAKFPMTGFSGISIILYRLLNIPIGLSTIVLNIPLAIVCYRLLGKKFFISSLRCMVLSSLMIDYVAPLFPVYEGDRLLAALCTGVFGGIGYALIYSKNSSTGGSDFIIMAVKAIKPHLSLGKIAFWSDVGIILVGRNFIPRYGRYYLWNGCKFYFCCCRRQVNVWNQCREAYIDRYRSWSSDL